MDVSTVYKGKGKGNGKKGKVKGKGKEKEKDKEKDPAVNFDAGMMERWITASETAGHSWS